MYSKGWALTTKEERAAQLARAASSGYGGDQSTPAAGNHGSGYHGDTGRPIELNPMPSGSRVPQDPITESQANPAGGADVSVSLDSDGKTIVMKVSGPIADGDKLKFGEAIHRELGMATNLPSVTGSYIELDSPGGSVSEAARIAESMKMIDIPVAVGKGDQCASACFLIFASAKNKLASRFAKIGVHSASNLDGVETVGTEAATTEMARAARSLGVPSQIIGRMVTTPPGDMAWLSEEELTSMGVKFPPAEIDN